LEATALDEWEVSHGGWGFVGCRQHVRVQGCWQQSASGLHAAFVYGSHLLSKLHALKVTLTAGGDCVHVCTCCLLVCRHGLRLRRSLLAWMHQSAMCGSRCVSGSS
jgi:hypothetical protein